MQNSIINNVIVNTNFTSFGLFVGFGVHTSGYTNITNTSINGNYNSNVDYCSLLFTNVSGNVSFNTVLVAPTYYFNCRTASVIII